MTPRTSGSDSHAKIVRDGSEGSGMLQRGTEWAWMTASGLAVALFFLSGLLIQT